MPEPDEEVLITIRAPRKLRDAVKKRAAERGTTVSEATRKFYERYTK